MGRSRRHTWGRAVICLGLAGLARPTVAATTHTVTDFGDNGAPGQLRTLISSAAFGDTIVIPAGTITLTGADREELNASGDLDIINDLTIRGASATTTIIDGGGVDRVFDIHLNNIHISDLTVQNGHLYNPLPATAEGGAGIRNAGTLELQRVIVQLNTMSGTGGSAAKGGGIANGGDLSVSDSIVRRNMTTDGGGGILHFGSSPAIIERCAIYDNTTHNTGGGIQAFKSISIRNTTVSGNST